MKLHELVSAEKAEEKSRSTQAVDQMMPAPVPQRFLAANYSITEWATVRDALLHPKADSSKSPIKAGADSAEETYSKQYQSTGALPSTVRALSSRLLEATKEICELKARLQSVTKKHTAMVEKYRALLLKYTALQEHAENVAYESNKVPHYCQGTKEDDGVEIPVSELKTQVQNLRHQIAKISERARQTRKYMRNFEATPFQCIGNI